MRYPEPNARRSPVMVVDDDPGIREVIQAIIEAEGYPAVTAANGAEALNQLRSGVRPAVILLDLRMPGMDGRTFLESQQAEPPLALIPVVILTGDRDGPKIASQLGSECITKPVDLEQLLSLVRRSCDGGLAE